MTQTYEPTLEPIERALNPTSRRGEDRGRRGRRSAPVMLDGLTIEQLNAEVPELMGPAEVAHELGVETNNLENYVSLPPSIPQTLDRGRLWRADVIREFVAKRRRRLGRGN
jgi:hypothetical protein